MSATGPDLLLLHGLGSRHQVFAPVVGELTLRHRVFALDLPGFGEALLEDTLRPGVAGYADWVEAEIERRGIRSPHIVGSSMGGGIALELARRGSASRVTVFSPIGFWSAPEQKERWLPGLASGALIGAIAMTEPGTGSDLQGIRTSARRDGDEWVLNGAKTFITSGIQADVVIVVAKSDPSAGSRGFSLFVVERDDPGFTRGRQLDKVGLDAQDTAELFFENVRLSGDRVLGSPGAAMRYLMERLPRERLSIAAAAVAASEAAVRWTLEYVHERTAFDQRIADFQNTRFVLAELETETDITRAYVEKAALALNDGDLTAVEASKAKWWASELQVRATSRCLQLFGGFGYMLEYPIARAYRDARIQTIYGGTTEIMKEIIGREQSARYTRT